MRLLVVLLLISSACTRERPVKIGVVNMKVLMDKSVWGRKHQKVIREALAEREKQWEKRCGTPIKEVTLKLEALKKKPDPVAEPLLLGERQRLGRMCYQLKAQFQREVEQINEEYAAKILKKVKETAALIGKNLRLDLVVTFFRGVVLYTSERVDITEKVVIALEEGP